MKKYGIYVILLIVVCSFFKVIGYAQNEQDFSYMLKEKEKCALCGERGNSLKSAYGNEKGVGLICLNDWQVVQVLMQEEKGQHGGIFYRQGAEGEYRIRMERVAGNKVSIVEYTAGKRNVPDTRKLSEILCLECLNKVREAVSIYGDHGKREAKAVCLVEFPSMEIYAIQQSSQYYVLDDFFVQSQCRKKKIQLTVFMVSSETF